MYITIIKKVNQRDYNKWLFNGSVEDAINKLEVYYNKLNTPNTIEDIADEINHTLEHRNKLLNKERYIQDIELPIANFPFRYDKILKWRCPIPEVRNYLHNQCGVKTKWYHKLFFKGKRYFKY